MIEHTMIISNMEMGDETFDCDVGSWNVTRARLGCEQGAHELVAFPIDQLFKAAERVEVDPVKVSAMIEDRTRLLKSPPLITAEEHGKIWLIDGHHRINALYRAGVIGEVVSFLIEEGEGEPYKIYYNGKRVAPWYKLTASR